MAAIAGRGDEDGGDGVASGHPASRALVETKRKARRFFWKHRRGEGWTMAAVVLVGAGTVINGEQCGRAIEAGAKFIVSRQIPATWKPVSSHP